MFNGIYGVQAQFQPTLPLRGATGARWPLHWEAWFQPTLPLRGATSSVGAAVRPNLFQPTLPLRGATLTTCVSVPASVVFQPTLPLRGATRKCPCCSRAPCRVSTHAPLAGSD